MKAKRTSDKTPKRGKPINCWLHDEDLQRLDRLRRALAARGHFASQSQVLRICLRIARPDAEFISAFEHVLAVDGRRK